MILKGDCLQTLKNLPDNSIDSIVSDPPYGLAFMGKKWDYQVPSKEIWIEALRVLKPGGHLLAFGGTRTYHRLVVNIEDAGFEIRDQVMWIYGSGFPKSQNISKAIDKKLGAKREVVGSYKIAGYGKDNVKHGTQNRTKFEFDKYSEEAVTQEAEKYQGWGTALKPANEPICVARKPIEKGLTVAENVIKWGVGAINIDESRIGTETTVKAGDQGEYYHTTIQGRWPANVLFDEIAAAELDQQSGTLKSGARSGKRNQPKTKNAFGKFELRDETPSAASEGGASRFFYVAKASKRERNQGLEGMPLRESQVNLPQGGIEEGNSRGHQTQNFHPTVKPVKLMEYLIKLVTPKGGTVLDPFAGSGTTGVAAKRLGFNFIGCELSPEYAEIAEKRIAHAEVG